MGHGAWSIGFRAWGMGKRIDDPSSPSASPRQAEDSHDWATRLINYETDVEAPDCGGTRSVASELPAMTQCRPRRSVALQPPKPKAGQVDYCRRPRSKFHISPAADRRGGQFDQEGNFQFRHPGRPVRRSRRRRRKRSGEPRFDRLTVLSEVDGGSTKTWIPGQARNDGPGT